MTLWQAADPAYFKIWKVLLLAFLGKNTHSLFATGRHSRMMCKRLAFRARKLFVNPPEAQCRRLA
jgi:hypothetical protein